MSNSLEGVTGWDAYKRLPGKTEGLRGQMEGALARFKGAAHALVMLLVAA